MNTSLTVRLTGDTNFIPVMYRVAEMAVGSTAAATYCVLSVARVGWDTEVNYSKWISTRSYDINSDTTTLIGRNPEGMIGMLGVLSVVALDGVVVYATQTPSMDQ